jgi:hypothetical protein
MSALRSRTGARSGWRSGMAFDLPAPGLRALAISPAAMIAGSCRFRSGCVRVSVGTNGGDVVVGVIGGAVPSTVTAGGGVATGVATGVTGCVVGAASGCGSWAAGTVVTVTGSSVAVVWFSLPLETEEESLVEPLVPAVVVSVGAVVGAELEGVSVEVELLGFVDGSELAPCGGGLDSEAEPEPELEAVVVLPVSELVGSEDAAGAGVELLSETVAGWDSVAGGDAVPVSSAHAGAASMHARSATSTTRHERRTTA